MNYGKLLRGALRWIGEAVAAATPATLTVRGPAVTPDPAVSALAVRLVALVERRAGELGTPRVFIPATEQDPAATRITVLLAGRPIAVVAPRPAHGPAEGWIDTTVHAVDRAVRRRLSVLVDVAAAAQAVTRSTPQARPLIEGALAHLVDSGISISRLDRIELDALVQQVPASATAELGELLIRKLAPREILVEAAADTLRGVEGRPDDLVRARKELFASTGLQFPDIRLIAVDEPPGTLRIRINDVTVARQLGTAAGWSEVATAIQVALHESASWFVLTSDVEAALDQLRDALPDLVDLVGRCYSTPLLTGCLREMLRHGDSIRNLPRILWLLLDVDGDVDADMVSIFEPLLLAGPSCSGRVPSEPVTLAARIRRAVAEDSRVREDPEDDDAIRIPDGVEDELAGATDATALAAAELRLLADVPITERPLRVVVRSSSAIALVRSALQALPYPPRVISMQEIGLSARRGLPSRVHI